MPKPLFAHPLLSPMVTTTPTGPAGGDLTGTYPNPQIAPLTITDGDVHDVSWTKITGAPTSMPPSGAAGGDLSGAYPNPAIAPLAVTNAKINDVAWTKVTGAPTTFPPSGAAGGDLAGSYPNPTVAKLAGAAIGVTTPLARGDILVADGTPALKRLPLGAASTQLQSNGNDVVWGTPLSGPPSGAAGGALTGSYPNPGVNYAAITGTPTALPPSGPAGGALTGTYPNPGVQYSAITGTPTSLPPSGAAGGDLSGSTYPNPTVTAAAKSKWTTGTTSITPTDATKQVVIPGPTTGSLAALQWGTRTAKGRIIPSAAADVTFLTHNLDLSSAAVWTQDDVTKPSWSFQLRSDATDSIIISRTAAGTTTTPTLLQLTNLGDLVVSPLSGQHHWLYQDGTLQISGAVATKSTGTTWANPSDRRLKDSIEDYPTGLAAILGLQPRTFVYNGKGGSQAGLRGYGYIADEVEPVMPEMLSSTRTKLNADEEETDIQTLDTSNVTLALVNAVQELAARVTALEAR